MKMLYVNQTDLEDDNDTVHFVGRSDIFIDEPFITKFIFSLILCIFMVMNVVGNVCTCVVIARDKTMRTPTNCYLFNLAVTDLLMAHFIPVEIYMIWSPSWYPFGETECQIHFILWDCLSNCGILTIAAFTVERYLVVSKPFLRQRLTMKSRVVKIICINWLIAILFAMPGLFYIDLVTNKTNAFCYFAVSDIIKIFLVMEAVVFFVIPMTIITVLYIMIAMKLKQTQRKRKHSPVYGNQERDKAVKMLGAVTGLFFFCWAPYSALRILLIIPKQSHDDYERAWRVLFYLSAINAYLSTVGNPILYSLMSRKFRQAFKDFFGGRGSMRRQTATHSTTKSTYYTNVPMQNSFKT